MIDFLEPDRKCHPDLRPGSTFTFSDDSV
jgi:hypothetical protein